MDAAGVGALIGVSTMLGIFLAIKLRDCYLKRQKREDKPKQPFQGLKRGHVKIRTVIPKLEKVESLNPEEERGAK